MIVVSDALWFVSGRFAVTGPAEWSNEFLCVFVDSQCRSCWGFVELPSMPLTFPMA